MFVRELKQVIERLKKELGALRTDRVSPVLLEGIMVDYYNTPTPLKSLATIIHPEARTLVIQPWDKTSLPLIEHAIEQSDLGLRPIPDKDVIRISVPPLTEERRRELVKLLGRHIEDARIAVRKEREDTLRDIDRRQKAKEISEDQKFRERNDAQKFVDEINKKIEDIWEQKEKEIMRV